LSSRPLVGAPGRYELRQPLKRDLFSRVERGVLLADDGSATSVILRDWRDAPLWTRPLSILLAQREACSIGALPPIDGVPALVARGRGWLMRSHVDGLPLHEAPPRDARWYAQARRLLQTVHKAGVTHNDLAKEPNWIVRDDGGPGIVDFQLARVARARRGSSRLLAREDLRHLLKHKRKYARALLTPTELRLLATPSAPARWMRRWIKPVYNTLTRRILGWQDREGQGPRP